jgi:hypothetical protein
MSCSILLPLALIVVVDSQSQILSFAARLAKDRISPAARTQMAALQRAFSGGAPTGIPCFAAIMEARSFV